MKSYNGYYIDHVVFHSEDEIDAFIKKQAVDKMGLLVKCFVNDPCMETSIALSNHQDYMHDVLGFDGIEIEHLEIEFMTQL